MHARYLKNWGKILQLPRIKHKFC